MAEYAANHSNRVRASLEKRDTVAEAIYDAGFNSSGADNDIFFAFVQSSLGSILVAQSRKGVCSILLGDDPAFLVRHLQDRFPKAKLIGNAPGYDDVVAKVVVLIEEPEI